MAKGLNYIEQGELEYLLEQLYEMLDEYDEEKTKQLKENN